MNSKNKHFKVFEKECDNHFDDYRNENEDEKQNYKNKKISKLPIHQLIKQIKIDELIWDSDVVSLYHSAMWDENSMYPRIETGYSFTEDMNDELVKKLNTGSLTKEMLF